MNASARPTFSGSHALQLIALVKRWNVTADQLLEGSGVDERDLEDPRFRLPGALLADLTERARTLTREPGVGFHLGLQKRFNMYGHLGLASMSAGTVREGIALLTRYTPTVTSAIDFELEVGAEQATVHIHERAAFAASRDIAIFSLLVGLRQWMIGMLGSHGVEPAFDIPIEKPAYFDRFAHLLPEARFAQSGLRMYLPARALDLELGTPNRAALRLALEACDRQLDELAVHEGGLPMRVRKLALDEARLRTVAEVARTLHVSARTLKRKLAAAQTSFSDLVELERRERAQQLLRKPDLTLEEIASQLHYANAASFARAFRRWTGEAPTQYRARRNVG